MMEVWTVTKSVDRGAGKVLRHKSKIIPFIRMLLFLEYRTKIKVNRAIDTRPVRVAKNIIVPPCS